MAEGSARNTSRGLVYARTLTVCACACACACVWSCHAGSLVVYLVQAKKLPPMPARSQVGSKILFDHVCNEIIQENL